jgi:hypothetical protein
VNSCHRRPVILTMRGILYGILPFDHFRVFGSSSFHQGVLEQPFEADRFHLKMDCTSEKVDS